MEALTELTTQLTALGTMGIIWLARMSIARINKMSRGKKWLLNLGVAFLLTEIGTFFGVEIDGLEALLRPDLAQTLSATLMSAGGWDLSKRLLRWRKRYNVGAGGTMVHTK